MSQEPDESTEVEKKDQELRNFNFKKAADELGPARVCKRKEPKKSEEKLGENDVQRSQVETAVVHEPRLVVIMIPNTQKTM